MPTKSHGLGSGKREFSAEREPALSGAVSTPYAIDVRGLTKRFATLVIDAGDQDPPYMATIWKDGAIVGELTSGYFGHRVGACIGLGMLKAGLNVPGTKVEVEIFGVRYPAVVQADQPLWDAKNERIRA